jgi:hypothetical protein
MALQEATSHHNHGGKRLRAQKGVSTLKLVEASAVGGISGITQLGF